jgi:hypothetical protein
MTIPSRSRHAQVSRSSYQLIEPGLAGSADAILQRGNENVPGAASETNTKTAFLLILVLLVAAIL